MTDNKSTALIVIDFINDIVNPESKTAPSAKYVADHQVIAHANQCIAYARQQNILLLFVKISFSKDYKECPENSPIFSRAKQLGIFQLNTPGTEFYSELDIQESDPVIIKHRVSAFYNTDLETYLRAQGIKKIFLSGVSTDMTIQLTAREAHDRDYQVVIVEDACGAANENVHRTTIESLLRIAKIIKSSEL